MDLVLSLDKVTLKNLPEVGGKNASLGEMIIELETLGIKVPNGFATTADAYRLFLRENKIEDKIYQKLDSLNIDNTSELQKASEYIENLILAANFSPEFTEEIKQAFNNLSSSEDLSFAVRSSATAEDLPDASFAGLQETYLNISGSDNILLAIKKVFASLFTMRAISYRVKNNFAHQDVAISAGVQQMVRSDLAASGVMFSVDTESGFDKVIFITGSYGLGEMVVQGAVNTDEFYVYKANNAILSRKLGTKKIKMIYGKNNEIKKIPVERQDQHKFCINDDEIKKLAEYANIIEKHYGKPMDIEWAKDGIDNEIYIIQARPETVVSHKSIDVIEQYFIESKKSDPIITGRSIGRKIGQGIARIIATPQEMDHLEKGEVLVTDMTDPDWEPIMKRASAIVTNRGGRTCHAAIIARELGVPAIVGCGKATDIIKNGDEITVSCAEGETGFVYFGLLKYKIKKVEVKKLPKLPIKICMNLANPEQAFGYQFLPNDGVGLARMEFIISKMIAIHPNAILNVDTLEQDLKNKINIKAEAYDSPKEFYIEKLAEGIATIAAAFHPKEVIVRFSDFKSNEYANLLGGYLYEPEEENPMLGYRGGSRYVSDSFKECFRLECEAIKRVRTNKGFDNVNIMFPFVRTVEEAKKLVEITEQNGLIRGKDKLKFYMMCEIPSNVLLAEKFLQYFDGFSIGSNDLTQLTLGLDRDSELVSESFDERNEAVKILLNDAIQICKKLGKHIGICGQGPSDHPDLAKWLMEQGIDTLSLTPDSIIQTIMELN